MQVPRQRADTRKTDTAAQHRFALAHGSCREATHKNRGGSQSGHGQGHVYGSEIGSKPRQRSQATKAGPAFFFAEALRAV